MTAIEIGALARIAAAGRTAARGRAVERGGTPLGQRPKVWHGSAEAEELAGPGQETLVLSLCGADETASDGLALCVSERQLAAQLDRQLEDDVLVH